MKNVPVISGKVVAVFDLEPIHIGSGHAAVHLRVEFLKRARAKHLDAKLWRFEFYRIQATFPQTRGAPSHEPADELVLVEEHMFLQNPLRTPCANIEDALQFVLKQLATKFDDLDKGS